MPTVEKPLTWSLLVSGDEMFSAKTGKWFEILEVRSRDGQVTVRLKGGEAGRPPITFTKPAITPVRVRRSEMGQAVDLFAVVFSGPA